MPEICRGAVSYIRKGSDKVGVLQLDDGKTNAFGHQLVMDSHDVLAEARQDLLQCCGALVLRGSARALSSGFDLKVLGGDADEGRALVSQGGALLSNLLLFPRPLVVAATGHAVAFGAFLLLAGDYRIGVGSVAGRPLKVGFNETANGFRMPDFAAGLARSMIAPQYLREVVALGLVFDAGRAAQVGFLDEVVENEEQAIEVAATKAKELATWCKHPAFLHNKTLVHGPVLQRFGSGEDAPMAKL